MHGSQKVRRLSIDIMPPLRWGAVVTRFWRAQGIESPPDGEEVDSQGEWGSLLGQGESPTAFLVLGPRSVRLVN
jgi:hypothetical protein